MCYSRVVELTEAEYNKFTLATFDWVEGATTKKY